VEIVLQPKQALLRRLCNGRATWLGYGGAKGGGKSGAILILQVLRRQQFPGTTGVILRRVWDDVYANHVEEFKRLFPDLAALYASREVRFPNGSKIRFMAAETYADLERKFNGPQCMDLFVDQAEQFAAKEIQHLKTCCRWPGVPDNSSKLGLFYNPGGVSAAFLKRIFHDKKYENKEEAEDYAFVQAYGWDNVEWAKPALASDGRTVDDFYSWDSERRFRYFITRTQYGRNLNSLPQHIRIGHLLGRFDRFAGQYFGAVYDREKLTITQKQMLALVKPWWTRWLSLDWGFFHHAVVMWWARGKVTREELRRATGLLSPKPVVDVIVTYKTITCEQESETALAEAIVKASSEHERKVIRHFFTGPVGQERKRKIGGLFTVQQIGRVMRQYGMPEPAIADDQRIAGWRVMYNQMQETFNCARVEAGVA
jgi:hypothetical protein